MGFRGGWLGEEHLIAPRDVEQAWPWWRPVQLLDPCPNSGTAAELGNKTTVSEWVAMAKTVHDWGSSRTCGQSPKGEKRQGGGGVGRPGWDGLRCLGFGQRLGIIPWKKIPPRARAGYLGCPDAWPEWRACVFILETSSNALLDRRTKLDWWNA